MASSTTDEGFHEIQLNGKQLVFLFMAVTVVSVVIFLCGVLVGRGVRAERGPEEPLVAEEAAVPDPPALATPTGTGAPATAGEDLSYPGRLSGADAPAEKLGEPPPVPAPAPPTDVAAEPAATPAASAARSEAASAPAASTVAAEPAGAGFAIQLAALRQREEANAIAVRLTGKGYPAYVVTPESGGPAVYRVRVGKFTDRREAESVAARLQKEEQFNPWIVR